MFLETMKFTAKTLLRKPVRSLLTMLQVSLGVAAVALVLNVIMQPDAAADGPSFIGADEELLHVYNGTEYEDERGFRTVGMTSIFTPEDIQVVRAIEGVVSIPLKQDDLRDTIELDGMLYLTSGLRPVNKDLMDMANPTVIEGTIFSSMDYENQSRTLIISQQAAKALFGDESPIGRKLAFTMSTPVGLASTTPMTSDSRSRFEGIREEFEIIGVVDISSGDEMPFNLRPEHFMAPLGEASTDSADRQTWPVTGGASMQVGPLAEGASPQAEPVTGSGRSGGPVTSGTSVQAGPLGQAAPTPRRAVATTPNLRSDPWRAARKSDGIVTRSASPQTGPVILGHLLSEF